MEGLYLRGIVVDEGRVVAEGLTMEILEYEKLFWRMN